MNDRGDSPGVGGREKPYAFLRRRRRSSSGRTWAILALVLVLVGAGAWYFWIRSPDPGEPVPAAAVTDDDATPDPEAPARERRLELPELADSDAFIRDLVRELSAHPQIARWIVTDDLIHRFVGSVVNLAGGASPVSQAEFMVPEQEFRVQEETGRLTIHPASYQRYDLLTEAFLSLDTEGSAELYYELHPLFEEAYAEYGIPDSSFDEAMALAVGNLLAAEIPSGPVEVERMEGVYEFADPALEDATAAEKHLVRMGPQNARRFQEKVAELSEAIGIQPVGGQLR